MRRLLVLLILAGAPLAVTAQTLTANRSTMNRAQCTGTRNAVRPDEPLTIDLTWTVKLIDTEASPAFTGTKYRIRAANKAFSTATADGKVPCDTFSDDSAVSGHLLEEFDSADSSINGREYNLSALAAAAYGTTDTCAEGNAGTLYVCVQWLNNTTVGAFATAGLLTTDLKVPAPPTNASATAGDSALRLNCTAGTDDTQYKALAQSTDPRDTRPHWSGQESSCSDLRVSGLVNNVPYTVTIYGLDDANNPSADGAITTGTPIPTHDYWDQCKIDGCPEKGGCATGGLAGVLGALSTLVLLRRRKS